MKKRLIVALLASMALSLTACGSITDKIDEVKENLLQKDSDDDPEDDSDEDDEDDKEDKEEKTKEIKDTEESTEEDSEDTLAYATEAEEASAFIEDYEIHEYDFITDDITWEEAWQEAIIRGGYLAHIDTEEEEQYLVDRLSNMLNPALCYFIGGKREAGSEEYYWVAPDGTQGTSELTWDSVCKKHWLEGEPSYYDETTGIEEMYMDILYLKKKDAWFLNDAPNDMIAASEAWSGKIGYIVEYDNNDVSSMAQSGSAGSTSGSDSSSFGSSQSMDFTFMSGAGGWATQMKLHSDGSFTGKYYDSDMGDTGPGYPNGTEYYCEFSGKFSNMRQIDDMTWAMNLTSLKEEKIKDGEIKDGVKYYQGYAYGLDDGDEFRVYMPGTRLSKLPEESQSWLSAYGLYDETVTDKYLICNMNTGQLWCQDVW